MLIQLLICNAILLVICIYLLLAKTRLQGKIVYGEKIELGGHIYKAERVR